METQQKQRKTVKSHFGFQGASNGYEPLYARLEALYAGVEEGRIEPEYGRLLLAIIRTVATIRHHELEYQQKYLEGPNG